MRNLMQRVKEDMKKKEITLARLHKESRVSKTVITEGISTGKTAEMKFDTFLKLISYIYETNSERKEIVNEFMLKCEYELNIRKSLCYCLCAGALDITEKLIEKHANNIPLKKYLYLYGLLNKRNTTMIRGSNLFNEIDQKSFAQSNECKALVNMLRDYSMYDSWDIQAMKLYVKQEENNLLGLQDNFIQQLLSLFYQHKLAYVELHKSQLDSCRERCLNILRNTDELRLQLPYLTATTWCCVGESYFFSDPPKAEGYIVRAINYLEQHGVSNSSKKYQAFKDTLSILYIENGFSLEKVDFRYLHGAGLGFFEGLHGNSKKGIIMLEQALIEKPNSPFVQYYLARVKCDIIGLQKAYKLFVELGNYHYGTACKRALKSLQVEV
ncbi:hypothetical protein COI63_26220 [Bacillus toyonensis]|uniref:AimR family lysis-lysogeny pheromone receptor n=1 Tax=Bacillus toyonensis TaxID=155322 RepID=UPI000BFE07BB|nr:AimR family lysis-lysogeny pheromone receptor [Bacillus toyonensis]PHG00538.1 hypothetical protein COI63_26220 [Bacillus toyonensis]